MGAHPKTPEAVETAAEPLLTEAVILPVLTRAIGRSSLPLVLAAGLATCEGQTAGGDADGGPTASLDETTIRAIQDAFASGTLSCQQLVEHYLSRIEAYDDQGPSLNAIPTVNPRALDAAREMDRLYAADGGTAGRSTAFP